VWNLLSHRYREVLIGLKGSKSILTLRCLPSSVITSLCMSGRVQEGNIPAEDDESIWGDAIV